MEDAELSIRTDSGRLVDFNLKDHPHIDYGYAVTSHSSQGQTADRVLIHVDTELGEQLVNARMASLLKGEPTKILRHSYRSWLGKTNAPVAVIKDLMRHSDIRTTFNEYGNGLPAPMREANSKVMQMVLR